MLNSNWIIIALFHAYAKYILTNIKNKISIENYFMIVFITFYHYFFLFKYVDGQQINRKIKLPMPYTIVKEKNKNVVNILISVNPLLSASLL